MEASPTRAATAAVIRLVATMEGMDPALLRALEKGTYVVDPQAVADAIVRRHERVAEARRLAVLVTAQLHDSPIGASQLDERAAGADFA
jgi:hypothetical protein